MSVRSSSTSVFGEGWPRIPDSAHQLAADTITVTREEKGAQFRRFFQGLAASLFLFQGAFVFAANFSGPAATTSLRRRVFKASGATAFTSIPLPFVSSANVSVKRTTAALEAAYALKRGLGVVA